MTAGTARPTHWFNRVVEPGMIKRLMIKRVAASEFEVLSVTRALFQRPGGRQPTILASLLRQERDLPARMGPTALGLMQDTIAKGLIIALVGRGGWQRVQSQENGQVWNGRLWERHAPPPLHLSPFAMHLCRWMTSQPLRSKKCKALPHTPATVADELLLYLALETAHQARCALAFSDMPAVRASALCWLGFADDMAPRSNQLASSPPADISVYAFAPWTSGSGVIVLDALQADLARRWVEVERDKRRLGDPVRLVALGRIQDALLRAYFGAIQGAERRDLCRFIIVAARTLMDERPAPEAWHPILTPGGSLRLRSDARRASVALLRNLRTIKHWADEAAAVRFFDDEYDGAQLFLRIWNNWANSAIARRRPSCQTSNPSTAWSTDSCGATTATLRDM